MNITITKSHNVEWAKQNLVGKRIKVFSTAGSEFDFETQIVEASGPRGKRYSLLGEVVFILKEDLGKDVVLVNGQEIQILN